MRVLFVGDVYAESGRSMLLEHLPMLKQTYKPNLILINAENIAHGRGITEKVYKEMMSHGIHAMTMGNHTWGQKDIFNFIEEANLIRPANYPNAVGKGFMQLRFNDKTLTVINLLGRVYMNNMPLDCPFKVVDDIIANTQSDYIIVDFHAEATSEKIAMGYHLDGRVNAVLGTHTHVQTADARKLENNTLYITDVGMTGPLDGVIGVERSIILDRFLKGHASPAKPASGKRQLNAVFMDLNQANPLITPIRITE